MSSSPGHFCFCPAPIFSLRVARDPPSWSLYKHPCIHKRTLRGFPFVTAPRHFRSSSTTSSFHHSTFIRKYIPLPYFSHILITDCTMSSPNNAENVRWIDLSQQQKKSVMRLRNSITSYNNRQKWKRQDEEMLQLLNSNEETIQYLEAMVLHLQGILHTEEPHAEDIFCAYQPPPFAA